MSEQPRDHAPAVLPAPGRKDSTATRRRPTPVTILAVVQLVTSIGYLATVLALTGNELQYLGELTRDGLVALGAEKASLIALNTGLAIITVLGFSSSILLFRMKRTGWTITMLVTGWSLATQISLYYIDGAKTLTPAIMLLNIVIVLYLNQRPVRAAFGIGITESDDTETELEERA